MLMNILSRRDPFKDHEERLAALGTSHITQHDAELLTTCVKHPHTAPLIVYAPNEHGWLINIVEGSFDPETLEREGFSQDLQRLLIEARDHGYSWILFDADALTHPDYPTHDW